MFKKLKNIRLRPMISHLIVTLAYPAVRAATADSNRLQLFTDAMTITALVLVIGGVVYSSILHGDYDISRFVFDRGARKEKKESFAAFKQNQKQKRAEAFNYPLFLGIVYLLAAAFIVYVIL